MPSMCHAVPVESVAQLHIILLRHTHVVRTRGEDRTQYAHWQRCSRSRGRVRLVIADARPCMPRRPSLGGAVCLIRLIHRHLVRTRSRVTAGSKSIWSAPDIGTFLPGSAFSVVSFLVQNGQYAGEPLFYYGLGSKDPNIDGKIAVVPLRLT